MPKSRASGASGASSDLFLGVDLGGTNLKLAVVDAAGQVGDRAVMPTAAHEGQDAVLARMAAAVRTMADAQVGRTIRAVGVGVPGDLDMATGVIRELTNFTGKWRQAPVGARLGKATGFPTHVINDVRAFTVAEHRLGAARGAETAACVAVGTGIGGGIVAHGLVHFGLGGAAGEMGHQIVMPDGIRCSCGNRGCVEALASGPAIAAEAMRRVVQGFTTSLSDLAAGDPAAITPELVARAAAAGDAVAIEILERAGYYLGLGIAGLIAIIAPEVVVLGGGVCQPGGYYWRSAEATARSHSHVTDIDRIVFRPAALGYDAGVIGAALWARQRSTESTAESGSRQ